MVSLVGCVGMEFEHGTTVMTSLDYTIQQFKCSMVPYSVLCCNTFKQYSVQWCCISVSWQELRWCCS